jgi:ribulose-phosphate 3-epimerase
MKKLIIPSIIAQDQAELDQRLLLAKRSGAKVMQLDVMDGHFVDNHSLDFKFQLRKEKGILYEAHLMMRNPMPWIYRNYKKVDVIIVHYESPYFREAVNFIRHHNRKVGVALNPITSFEHYENLDFKFDL